MKLLYLLLNCIARNFLQDLVLNPEIYFGGFTYSGWNPRSCTEIQRGVGRGPLVRKAEVDSLVPMSLFWVWIQVAGPA